MLKNCCFNCSYYKCRRINDRYEHICYKEWWNETLIAEDEIYDKWCDKGYVSPFSMTADPFN